MDKLTGFVKTVLFRYTSFSRWAATGCRLSVAYRTLAKISHKLYLNLSRS